jgi:hypothetical protein
VLQSGDKITSGNHYRYINRHLLSRYCPAQTPFRLAFRRHSSHNAVDRRQCSNGDSPVGAERTPAGGILPDASPPRGTIRATAQTPALTKISAELLPWKAGGLCGPLIRYSDLPTVPPSRHFEYQSSSHRHGWKDTYRDRSLPQLTCAHENGCVPNAWPRHSRRSQALKISIPVEDTL